MQIIPAIDLLGGRCVRLYKGDFEQVSSYDHDPVELAQRYRKAGLSLLHVVDLDGARTGKPDNLAIISELAAGSGMQVQAGGGIRNRERLETLLQSGIERVVIGSVAVTEPAQTAQWLSEQGPERIVFAFDVQISADGEPEALTHGWTRGSGQHLWTLLDFYLERGARHFLCTDIARDGTLSGANTALYRECVRRYPTARFQASGGLASANELTILGKTGVAGIITGKALLDGRLSLAEVEKFLQNA